MLPGEGKHGNVSVLIQDGEQSPFLNQMSWSDYFWLKNTHSIAIFCAIEV